MVDESGHECFRSSIGHQLVKNIAILTWWATTIKAFMAGAAAIFKPVGCRKTFPGSQSHQAGTELSFDKQF